MKKYALFFIISICMFLSSCGNELASKDASQENIRESDPPEISSSSYVEPTERTDENKADSNEEYSTDASADDNEVGGTAAQCTEHCYSYHAVDSSLVDYIGQDIVHGWYDEISGKDDYGRVNEDFSILTFIQQFDISKETFSSVLRGSITDSLLEALEMSYDEYTKEFGYTDEQIDALYSGDKSKINEAFCGEMAYYNPDDGELYSIYWLSDHTGADYASAAIPESEVSRIMTAAEEAGDIYLKLAEKSRVAAEAYISETKETE